MLKRTPGGLESLPDRERARWQAIADEQLQRAVTVLKDLAQYDQLLAAPKSPKVAAQ